MSYLKEHFHFSELNPPLATIFNPTDPKEQQQSNSLDRNYYVARGQKPLECFNFNNPIYEESPILHKVLFLSTTNRYTVPQSLVILFGP